MLAWSWSARRAFGRFGRGIGIACSMGSAWGSGSADPAARASCCAVSAGWVASCSAAAAQPRGASDPAQLRRPASSTSWSGSWPSSPHAQWVAPWRAARPANLPGADRARSKAGPDLSGPVGACVGLCGRPDYSESGAVSHSSSIFSSRA